MVQQPVILQDKLPVQPWAEPRTSRLPGVNPLDWADWLLCDSTYAAQMAEKDRLLQEETKAVLSDGAEAAAAEHLTLMRRHLPPDFIDHGDAITRPDGVTVGLHGSLLVAAARLVQQDICIMERRGAEHVLTAAALCFPSNWRLADKVGRPMTAIHDPVEIYDEMLAKRVQRIFDAMQPDRPVWRMNHLLYKDAELFQPFRLAKVTKATGRYIRCERQSLVKLPETRAIVFGIHVIVVPINSLSSAEQKVFFENAKEPYHE